MNPTQPKTTTSKKIEMVLITPASTICGYDGIVVYITRPFLGIEIFQPVFDALITSANIA